MSTRTEKIVLWRILTQSYFDDFCENDFFTHRRFHSEAVLGDMGMLRQATLGETIRQRSPGGHPQYWSFPESNRRSSSSIPFSLTKAASSDVIGNAHRN
jgi:hypothetical protein